MSVLLIRLPMACDYITVLDNIHDNHLWLKNTMMHTDATECFSSLAREWKVWKVWEWRKSSQHSSRKRRTSWVGGLIKIPYKECWRQQTQKRRLFITESLFPNHGNLFLFLIDLDETLKHWQRDCCQLINVTSCYIYNHISEETFYYQQSQTTTEGKIHSEVKVTRLRNPFAS